MRALAKEMNVLLWRRGLAPVLLLVIGLILSNCTGDSGSLFKDDSATIAPTGRPVPPIVLQSMAGLPDDKVQALRDALSTAGGQRDLAIVEGAFNSGEFVLAGSFQVAPEGDGIRVGYRWTLTDPAGATLHVVKRSEFAPGAAGTAPWDAVTSDILDKIAVATAQDLASKLAQLGYATRAAALHMPPPEYFIAAAPQAFKEIDYETLLGPGAVNPNAAVIEEPVDIEPSLEETVAAMKEQPQNQIDIRAVAVLMVKGSPGKGNVELTKAMRQTLKVAGWPVLSAPRADAITITGKVRIEAAKGASQQVALIWTVHSPDGRKLGKIDQANGVPAGSLDAGWGNNATLVAEAAATGIFDLIRVYR